MPTRETIEKGAAAPTIPAWSASRLSTWENCPFKAKLLYIEGLKEPGSAALEYGSEIHDNAANYLMYRDDPGAELHPDLRDFKDDFDGLVDAKAHAEMKLAFTREGVPCEWMARDVWARIMIDALVEWGDTVRIIDFKTGKRRATDEKQMAIYAWAAFLAYPTAQQVKAELWYTRSDVKIFDVLTYEREEFDELAKQVLDRVEPMMNDETFLPRPSGLCAFCDFSKVHGNQPKCEAG